MHVKLQVIIDEPHGEPATVDIITLDKSISGEGLLGLSLDESKRLLKALQQTVVRAQVEAYTTAHRCCPHCGAPRRSKGHYDIQYRTLFGIVSIPNTRLYRCSCEASESKTFGVLNDWLRDHNSPELRYIETKWASLMSYGMTVDLLKDVLPVSNSLSGETVRHHLCKTAGRMEAELQDQPRFVSGCPNQWAELPRPDKPMTVGVDGGYVRDCRQKKTNFEVIIGKAFSKTRSPKRLGFVQALDDRPGRRLLSLLRDQGLQDNQQITFLSDGADNLRDLQQLMHPEAEHVLDWFHLTMRLTVLTQFAKGLRQSDPNEGAELLKILESTKWNLWHGKVEQALMTLDECYALASDPALRYRNRSRLIQYLADMMTYVDNNGHLIPNYGEKHRYGETISTAFVESTVNEIVAKRMVKKQQMQWSREGAHSLLQTRTSVLNGDLRSRFETWHPEMRSPGPAGQEHEPVKFAA
ncbi:MAG: ISKra4 family transposase [Pseudomonadota bacterium]